MLPAWFANWLLEHWQFLRFPLFFHKVNRTYVSKLGMACHMLELKTSTKKYLLIINMFNLEGLLTIDYKAFPYYERRSTEFSSLYQV